MARSRKLFFETEYFDTERGGHYGCAVAVDGVHELEDCLHARGLGERAVSGPHGRAFGVDHEQRASAKLRRMAHKVERRLYDHDLWQEVMHAGVFCAMLADRSGAAHVGAMVRDGGLLHEVVHAFYHPKTKYERRMLARNLRRLAGRWAKLERNLPGLIP